MYILFTTHFRMSERRVNGQPEGKMREGEPRCLVLKPKSVIRVQSNFVLLPCRLSTTFAEGVAGYAKTKRQTRCRQQDKRAWKTEERQPNPKSVV